MKTEKRKAVWIPVWDGYADGEPAVDYYECSECGYWHDGDGTLFPYCPMCGAKMLVDDDYRVEQTKDIIHDRVNNILLLVDAIKKEFIKNGDDAILEWAETATYNVKAEAKILDSVAEEMKQR